MVHRARQSVPLAMAQFAITGLVGVIVLGVIGVQVLRQIGTSEAIRNAKELTRLAGAGIVAPSISKGVVARSPASLHALDRVVRARVLRAPVVRVKIWQVDSRIVYSDEPRLIGARYHLSPDELRALRTGGTDAEVSDLSRPENRFERSQKKLLEVYQGISTRTGQRLLFEDYLSFSSVSASGRRLWESFAPALVGGLVLLELAQIPLAWSLARRLRRGQEEREALLRRAIEASDVERQRIARDLHDGVVQNLAGVSYSLSAVAQGSSDEGASQARDEAIQQAAFQTRRSIRQLRTLLVDLYPPDLHRAGLPAALGDLLAPLKERQVITRLDADPELHLEPDVEALLFRIAQEALRNALKHSEARLVEVSVKKVDHTALLAVSDDGKGFDPDDPGLEGGGRHFGLRSLGDLARDADAHLTIASSRGEGTRIEVRLPLR